MNIFMDQELESTINDIIHGYLKKHNLNVSNQVIDLDTLIEHVNYVLWTHYSYREDIPNLKMKIIEIINNLKTS